MKKNNKIYKILCIIIFIVILPFCIFMATKENSNHDEAKKSNLDLISELVDYKKLDAIEINMENSIDKCNSFIIVRNTNDGWDLNRAYNGKEFYKKWTKEDLLNYDLIVFAISTYDSKLYEDSAGKTSYLTSESVTLYYYNIKENKVFEKEFIKGGELKETEKYNHEISSNDIFDKIKNRFIK